MNNTQISTSFDQDYLRLGELQRTFQAKGAIKKIMLGVGIFLILGSLCWLSFLPSVLAEGGGVGVVVGMAIALFLGGALSLGVYYVHKKRRVDVYENGLVISTWRGSTAFLWDEIEDVERHHVHVYLEQRRPGLGKEKTLVDRRYTITGKDGRTAEIQSIENAAALEKILEKFM